MSLYATGFEVMRKVAIHASFSKAAIALDVSGAAVSRQIKTLEERLGLVLFHRTTRSVVITEAGKRLIDTLNRGDDEVSQLLEQLAEGKERPSGRLKINAPMGFGEKFLIGPIADYARLYPDVIVDAEFNDKRVHLVDEGYDLVVRIGALEDSGLIAKRLCDCPSYLCASPSFIERHGTPKTPDDLRTLPAVIYTNSSSGSVFNYRSTAGQHSSINLKAAIYANSTGMLLESTVQGIGFAQLPEFVCQQNLEDGKLIKLLPDNEIMPEKGIYVIYPDKRFLPLKVRKFIDMLSERLGKNGYIPAPNAS